jgi:hypothetical protein
MNEVWFVTKKKKIFIILFVLCFGYSIFSFSLKPFFSSSAFISSLPFPEQVSHEYTLGFVEFAQRYLSIRDRQIHSQLQSDLMEHMW